MDQLLLEFDVPRGKVSQIMNMMNYLQSKFNSLNIAIKAVDGSISEDDYINKIKETLKQLGIHVD
jgi:hypothetical protein